MNMNVISKIIETEQKAEQIVADAKLIIKETNEEYNGKHEYLVSENNNLIKKEKEKLKKKCDEKIENISENAKLNFEKKLLLHIEKMNKNKTNAIDYILYKMMEAYGNS